MTQATRAALEALNHRFDLGLDCSERAIGLAAVQARGRSASRAQFF
ncbi:MAG: hypothetical protein ACE5FE_03870 [Acidiferrobacterales bacterium]